MNAFKQYENNLKQFSQLKNHSDLLLNEPIAEGKWSIREILGHLYYWDKFNLDKMVPLMEDGANLPEFPDHDTFNEEAITSLQNDSAANIIEKLIATRKQLIDEVSRLDENMRFTIGEAKRKYSTESFIKRFVAHDELHIKQITEKLGNQ